MKNALLPGQTRSCWTTPGSPWWAAAGRAASSPRVSAASSRGGRPPSSWSTTTAWSPTTSCARTSTQKTWGRFKSQALADRLARAYRRPVGYSVYPFREYESQPSRATATPASPPTATASSSAAPTTPPRGRAMAETLPGDPRRWLIDAGNDTNWGQLLVGNVAEPVTLDEPPFSGETCHLAPAPTLQRPDLLTAVSTRPPGRGLRRGPRPHRPGPDHQPDDGVAGAYRWSAAWWREPAPSWASTWTWSMGTVTPSYVTPEAVVRVVGPGSEWEISA